MANDVSQGHGARPYRNTLRLTFRIENGEARLVKHERLDMICPPFVGERPEAGKHGGFWIELRDADGRAVFHRALHAPLGDSVEVYSPDGTIRREVGPPSGSTFELLVPDRADARTVVLVGEHLGGPAAERALVAPSAASAAVTRDLARFDIPN